MKKLLGIVVLGLLLSGKAYANLTFVCGLNKIKVDKKYIYEYFGSGAVHKYKITNRTPNYVSGFLKGEYHNFDVFLDLAGKSLTVNKKNRKEGFTGSYTEDCY